MRKTAAILLILLLSFNWYGYRLVISVMQGNADRKLESLIDNSEYDASQLTEIRVAMNMPYQQRFTEYERHYGEIEIEGKTYTYVKRKVEGDVVILQCIANKSKQELQAIKNDVTKANSGIDTEHPGNQQQKSSFAKNFWSEYDEQNVFHILNDQNCLNTSSLSSYFFLIPRINGNTPHQPPEC